MSDDSRLLGVVCAVGWVGENGSSDLLTLGERLGMMSATDSVGIGDWSLIMLWHDEEDQIANVHTDMGGECCDTCGDRAVYSSSVWDGFAGVSVPSFLCGECGAVAIGEQGYEVGRDLFRLVK